MKITSNIYKNKQELMKRQFLHLLLCNFLMFCALTGIAQTDSLLNGNQSLSYFQKGDTLANLNLLNNGVKSVLIPEHTKIPGGLEVKPNGIILIDKSDFFNAAKLPVVFELKTYTSNSEFYINTIQVYKQNGQPLVYVAADKIEMATSWRKNGKIYVVIAVSLILFLVIIVYLIVLDKRTKAAMRE